MRRCSVHPRRRVAPLIIAWLAILAGAGCEGLFGDLGGTPFPGGDASVAGDSGSTVALDAGSPVDAGPVPDAGADGGGGPGDAGWPDSGAVDAGPTSDAGAVDAGPTSDAGSTYASGPLHVHPQNPRYFADAQGRVVYLTGSHTWDNLVDDGPTDPPSPFDFTAYLDFLTARHHNFFRLWRAENAKGGEGAYATNYWFDPMPYARPGPGTAFDGKPKFDLSQFNQPYFDRMRARVQAAGQRGIYVSVMLFDGWSIVGKGGSHSPWPGHPYRGANNVNGVEGDANGNGQGEELQTLPLSASLRALEEAYVRKVVDTVNDLDNVLYEVSNESEGNSEAWQYQMISFVKTYEAALPKQHPVGMTVEYPNGSNADLWASPADWVSPSGDVNNPAVAAGAKVVLGDTDHLCGICGSPAWVWKSLVRGQNPIFMDRYSAGVTTRGADSSYDPNDANDVAIRSSLGYAAQVAQRINLAAMTPQGSLASSGYALASAAPSQAEYLVFVPGGGSVTVTLAAASSPLSVEWINPATGQSSAGAAVSGGAARTFNPPFGGDALLHILAPP